MNTAEAISASTTGMLKPASMSGEKRLRRTNEETALRLYRCCIKISSPLFCYTMKHSELSRIQMTYGGYYPIGGEGDA